MTYSVAEMVREHIKASRAFQREIENDPRKAREFLKSIGVTKPSKPARPKKRKV